MKFYDFVSEYCDEASIAIGGGNYFLNKNPIHYISIYSLDSKIETDIENQALKEALIKTIHSDKNVPQTISKFVPKCIFCMFGEGKGLWLLDYDGNELFYYSYTMGPVIFGKSYSDYDKNNELSKNLENLANIINSNDVI